MANNITTPKSLEDENSVIRALEQLASVKSTENTKQSDIANLDQALGTVSGSYTQNEIVQLAANVKANADKLDTVLAALRAANLLGD